MKLSKLAIAIIAALTAVCIALGVMLSIVNDTVSTYKDESVQALAKVQLADERLVKLGNTTISMEQFKFYAEKYGVGGEFIQRFFDSEIVYRNDDGVVYSPIDRSLPRSQLNFDNLVEADGEIQYHENGVNAGIKGIDVSKHQGNINWSKVKNDGVEFAIIRLGNRGYGNGEMLIDNMFNANMVGAAKAGIPLGVYYYSQAITEAEAIEEADVVIDKLKDYTLSYPVVFDMEEITEDGARTKDLTTQERTDITIAFCEQVAAAGYTPMVYGNVKWLVEMVDMTRLTKYDKWFAQYYRIPFFPYDLKMWQYTSKGEVDGIEGGVDMNICFTDYSAK